MRIYDIRRLKELFRGVAAYYGGGRILILQEEHRHHLRFAVVYNEQKHFRVFAVTDGMRTITGTSVYVYASLQEDHDVLPQPGLGPLRAFIYYCDPSPHPVEPLADWLSIVTPLTAPTSILALQQMPDISMSDT
jgi:hypothetical protein